MKSILAAAAASLCLAGCATLPSTERLFGSDVSIVQAALLVQAVREADPDIGEFDTRLAAYAAIDCLRLADEDQRRSCTVQAIASLGR